jgi:hypothetical protein
MERPGGSLGAFADQRTIVAVRRIFFCNKITRKQGLGRRRATGAPRSMRGVLRATRRSRANALEDELTYLRGRIPDANFKCWQEVPRRNRAARLGGPRPPVSARALICYQTGGSPALPTDSRSTREFRSRRRAYFADSSRTSLEVEGVPGDAVVRSSPSPASSFGSQTSAPCRLWSVEVHSRFQSAWAF